MKVGVGPGVACGNRLLSEHRPLAQDSMHHRYLSAARASSYSFRARMSTMDSPQRPERRHIRYPLHLPVSLKVADMELHARSENISCGGILLSSGFLIPEGSAVEVAFGVVSLPDTGTQSSVRGKVLRVRPKATGDFAVAIAFEHPFRDGLQGVGSGSQERDLASPKRKYRTVTGRGLHLAWAWHRET